MCGDPDAIDRHEIANLNWDLIGDLVLAWRPAARHSEDQENVGMIDLLMFGYVHGPNKPARAEPLVEGGGQAVASVGRADKPVSLLRQYRLKRRTIPQAVRDEMMQPVVKIGRHVSRRRPDGLAFPGTISPATYKGTSAAAFYG